MAKKSGCSHHWIIGDPVGPKSPGKCRLCGKQREFLNSWDAAVEARFFQAIHHAWKPKNKKRQGNIIFGYMLATRPDYEEDVMDKE